MRLPNWLRGWAARLRFHTERRVVRKHQRGGVTTVQTAPSFHLHITPMAKPRQRSKPAPGPRIPSVAEVRLRNRQEDARNAKAEAVRGQTVTVHQQAAALTEAGLIGKDAPRLTRDQIRAQVAADPALRAQLGYPPIGPARRPAVTQRLSPAQANTRGPQPVKVKPFTRADGTAVKGYRRAAPGTGMGGK